LGRHSVCPTLLLQQANPWAGTPFVQRCYYSRLTLGPALRLSNVVTTAGLPLGPVCSMHKNPPISRQLSYIRLMLFYRWQSMLVQRCASLFQIGESQRWTKKCIRSNNNCPTLVQRFNIGQQWYQIRCLTYYCIL